MLKVRERIFKPLTISFYSFVVIFLITLLYFEDIYQVLFSKKVLLTLLFYLGIYITIFLVLLLFYINRRYEFKKNSLIFSNKFLVFKRIKTYKYDSSNLLIEISNTPVTSLLYIYRVRFYTESRKKILDSYMNKSEIDNLIKDEFVIESDIKKPFKRSSSHYQSSSDYLSILSNSFFESLIIFSIILMVFGIFKIHSIKVFGVSTPIWLFGVFLLLELFFIITIFRIISLFRMDFRIEENHVFLSKGGMFKYRYYIPRDFLNEAVLISGPFDKILNIIRLRIKKTGIFFITIRLKDRNLDKIYEYPIKKNANPKNSYFLILLAEVILSIVVCFFLSIYDLYLGVPLSLVSLTIFINGAFKEKTILADDLLILYNGVFIRRVKIIKKDHVVAVKYKRINKNDYFMMLETNNHYYMRIIKRVEYYSLKDE